MLLQPKVYSTKSSRRMTFVGGSKMNGEDLPQFGIFPVAFEKQWVAGPPKCRQVDPEGNPLPARYDFTKSGGMTNEMMLKFFHSVIVPSTPGCENVRGKRHIQLTDSAGPHCWLDYLKLCNQRGVVFIPRTPYLSHREQNEDVVHFGQFKIDQRKEKEKWQNKLLEQFIHSNKVADRTLGFDHTMVITRGPWGRAFTEEMCRKGYKLCGYYPFSRLPMIKLMKEKMAAEAAAEGKMKRHKTSRDAAGSIPTHQALKRIKLAQPKWFQFPSAGEVNHKTKFPAHVMAQERRSPTSNEAIAIMGKKHESPTRWPRKKWERLPPKPSVKRAPKTGTTSSWV